MVVRRELTLSLVCSCELAPRALALSRPAFCPQNNKTPLIPDWNLMNQHLLLSLTLSHRAHQCVIFSIRGMSVLLNLQPSGSCALPVTCLSGILAGGSRLLSVTDTVVWRCKTPSNRCSFEHNTSTANVLSLCGYALPRPVCFICISSSVSCLSTSPRVQDCRMELKTHHQPPREGLLGHRCSHSSAYLTLSGACVSELT